MTGEPAAHISATSVRVELVGSTDDVLATRLRWERVGLLTRDEMQTSCCYAKQDKTWVRDPDGYTVVLASPDGDAEE